MSILIFGCKKDDESKDKDGIVISKIPIWTSQTTDDDSLAINVLFKKALIYNNSIVVRVRNNKKESVRLLDVDDGIKKWEWSDFTEWQGYSKDSYCLLGNKLIWQFYYNNYCIDLNTGNTLWKNNFEENYDNRCSGIDNFFTVSHLTNRNKPPLENGGNIVVLDAATGKPIEFFKPKYDTLGKAPFEQYGWSYNGYGVPFLKNNEKYILVKFNDPPNLVPNTAREYLGLYNFSKKAWVYEKQRLKNNDAGSKTPHAPYLYNEKAYSGCDGAIVCHDLMTGNKLWETTIKAGAYYQSAGLLVDNGRVYANSDGGQLVCLDANSGAVKWDIRSSGSSTALSYLNGVVYFVGGGDGKLHAVDAETGDYLWKIESPDKDKNKWAIFWGMCGVVPGKGSEKGKIVVTTGLNAYCYEAIR